MSDDKVMMNEFGDIKDPNKKGLLYRGNCISKMVFAYAVKVFKLGNRKHFTAEDAWGSNDFHCYGHNHHHYTKFSSKYPLKEYSLFSTMFKWVLQRWIWVIISFTIGNFTSIVYPYLLRATIQWLEKSIEGTPLRKFI